MPDLRQVCANAGKPDFPLRGNAMHDYVLLEVEMGTRVAACQDAEDVGMGALLDESFLWYCAKEAYEEATAELRRHTVAAWVRWDELDDEVRWIWVNHIRFTA